MNPDLDTLRKVELEKIFLESDADGNGLMDFTEFEDMLANLRHRRQVAITSHRWSEGNEKLLQTMAFDWERQMKWIDQKIEAARTMEKKKKGREMKHARSLWQQQDAKFRNRLRRLFREIDVDDSGEIDMIELRIGVAKLELGLSEVGDLSQRHTLNASLRKSLSSEPETLETPQNPDL